MNHETRDDKWEGVAKNILQYLITYERFLPTERVLIRTVEWPQSVEANHNATLIFLKKSNLFC